MVVILSHKGEGTEFISTLPQGGGGGAQLHFKANFAHFRIPLPQDNYCTVPYVSRRKTKELNSSRKRKLSSDLVNHQNERNCSRSGCQLLKFACKIDDDFKQNK